MCALQVAMPSLDRRANVFVTIAPRLDPAMLTSYKEYWAFHDPVLARATARPGGEIFTLDSLMPREEFAATPVFNEFWRPAEFSLDTLGATLLAQDQLSALICFSNGAGKAVTADQMHTLKTMLPHLARAVRISRRLRRLGRHFGLTSAESALAVEILKGDGRIAAARRCGITCGTAKTHLSSIFEKTGTHRQAELVRVLLAAAGTRETATKYEAPAWPS
jgi:DNA-binding CsgD family transcriptional regulator